jgi:hypothetical protein
MNQETQENQARKRASVIFRVRSGEITAQEGARILGISRTAYYEWEGRALQAMTDVLENRVTGRPVEQKDAEKESLKERIRELEQKLFVMEKTALVREANFVYRQQHEPEGDAKKNMRVKRER